MTKITVVLDKKTNKFYPFVYGDCGEIIITSTDKLNDEDLIVTTVDTRCIDWETSTILKEPQKQKMENRPFYADFYN